MTKSFETGLKAGSALRGMVDNANAQIAASQSAARPEAETKPVYHRQVERNAVEDELWQRYQSAFANGAENDEILAITMELLRSPNVRLNVKVLTMREIFRQNSTLENATAIIEALGDSADAEYTDKPKPELSLVR